MASVIKSALPTHLKPNSGDEQGNERRHGKTRSHMMRLRTLLAHSEASLYLKSSIVTLIVSHMDIQALDHGCKQARVSTSLHFCQMDLVPARAFPQSLMMTLKFLAEGAELRPSSLSSQQTLCAFENTSTNVAAAQMRNALTNLAETVKDPEQKKASPSTRNM
ncbi:UTP-glucose-1-phosphate uridylyltransferase [Fusarium sp. NRRL 52700]|nr:UTP-glucose-1-phosphate uridylyltransferase [Fusarium sp. NRRL 52700]